MRYSLLLFFILISFIKLDAQAYFTAGGVRLGSELGITLQQRIAERVTVEGILQTSLRRSEVTFTGLIEQHQPIITRNLNLYYGAGLHKGWVLANQPTYKDPFGITGIVGLELSLGKFNLSYDMKPLINVSGGNQLLNFETALSLRYVLISDKEYRKRQREKERQKRKEARQKRRQNGEGIWGVFKKA